MANAKLKPDPRSALVREIERTMDRALASPHREACNASLPATMGAVIVSQYDNCEQFLGWSRESCRAIVLAYAQNAPMADLRTMAKIAVEKYAEIEAWDDHECRELGCCAIARKEAA